MQRVLVMGAGAVGGFFGARLVEAGRDVTFLVRPARAAQLSQHGVVIRSADGERAVPVRSVTADALGGDYDVVLLAVKSYGLDAALDDIAPAMAGGAVVIPLLNGMRHVDQLRERFGAGNVLGGLCLVATQLDADGAIRQLQRTAILRLGEFDGASSERVRAIGELMAPADFTSGVSEQIELEMWEKWVLLASMGALTCLLRGTIGEIEAAPGGADVARGILAEATAVAAAEGFVVRPEVYESDERALTKPGSAVASSMYRDLSDRRDVESDQIVGDLVDRAGRHGVAVPLLTLARAGLAVYRSRLLAEQAADA